MSVPPAGHGLARAAGAELAIGSGDAPLSLTPPTSPSWAGVASASALAGSAALASLRPTTALDGGSPNSRSVTYCSRRTIVAPPPASRTRTTARSDMRDSATKPLHCSHATVSGRLASDSSGGAHDGAPSVVGVTSYASVKPAAPGASPAWAGYVRSSGFGKIGRAHV